MAAKEVCGGRKFLDNAADNWMQARSSQRCELFSALEKKAGVG
jgi:hypothetical protein